MNVFDEGDACPTECGGRLERVQQGVCSCHINPPCNACMDAPLLCGNCGENPYEYEEANAE